MNFCKDRTNFQHLLDLAARAQAFGRAASCHLRGGSIDPADAELMNDGYLDEHIDVFGHDAEAWRISHWLMVVSILTAISEYAQWHETPREAVETQLWHAVGDWTGPDPVEGLFD